MIEILLEAGNSNEAGGCNSCMRSATLKKIPGYRVWIMTLHHFQVRVCDNCRADFVKGLQQLAENLRRPE